MLALCVYPCVACPASHAALVYAGMCTFVNMCMFATKPLQAYREAMKLYTYKATTEDIVLGVGSEYDVVFSPCLRSLRIKGAGSS